MAAALLIVLLPEQVPVVRIVLGFVFVLLVPGYALTAALFAGSHDIDEVERIVLTVGLSMVAVFLMGLVLNYTPWGIHVVPMTVALASLTLVALITAVRQRARHRLPDAGSAAARAAGSAWPALRLIVVVAAAVAAVVMTTQALRPPSTATEFYLLGAADGLEDYTTNLAPQGTFTATVGITNREGRRTTFLIVVPHTDVSLEVPPLDDGTVWEQVVEIEAARLRGLSEVTFELYRHGDAVPFRIVHVAVTVGSWLVQPQTRAFAPGGAASA